ncbi:hypothetical protein [Luteolibacter sp. LG18]|uniref:hypothetical protein n=1 Tax=Luteolibacter sp. LG18 TaxID=2819286 RepID=UPI002B2CA20A|nr:hypothetical protein llg_42930 [Luteolibacter sp. LG18]
MATFRCYFEGDHPGLVKRIEEHFRRMEAVWAEIAGKATGLALGGGYGRGEGGVLETAGGGPGLFNDFDYFLFTDHPDDPAVIAWARAREREETAALGVDVEIKTLPPSDVERGMDTMMFADLVAGNVPVAGDCGFLSRLAAGVDFRRIGADDAARLLWNRGSGLYFARGRMTTDPAFVIRNHAKLKLALGDALLCLDGAYVPWCRERGERVAAASQPVAVPELPAWHAEAVEFKFRPFTQAPDRAHLEAESRRLATAWLEVFLTVEARRLGCAIPDLESYRALPVVVPASPWWRNAALAARDRLKRGAFLRPWRDYPRGALMRALPCLLELGGSSEMDAGSFLPVPAGGEGWQGAYARWWQYYS